MGKRTFRPPASVAREAAEGLALRRSLPPSRRCCTNVGIRRAVQLSNRQPVSIDTIKRMRSYFARHEVDRKGKGWGVDSKGWQAWLLWGGDSGRLWADRLLSEYESNPGVETNFDPETLTEEQKQDLIDFDDPAWGMEDQIRRQQVVDRIVAAGPRAFIAPVSEASEMEVMVHQDSVHPGNWRATYIDRDGPVGHDEAIRSTPEESFRDIVTDLKYRANLYKMEWFTKDGFERPKDWFKKNPMAPGYQSYAWTTQDWRVVVVKSDGMIDYSDKCGAPSNSLSGGRKRLCLPAPVIKRLVRSKSGKEILIQQARKKERAKPGVSVRWDPRIRDFWRELEAKTVEDRER